MNPILYPLPYDALGNDPKNYLVEIHDLKEQHSVPNKIIVLNNGYFYKHDLVISDSHDNVIDGSNYKVTLNNSKLTKDTALANAAVIVITGKLSHTLVKVTARMVGGEYCNVNKGVVTHLDNLLNNSRAVHWENIKDKQDQFPSTGHLHALWELYGFTPPTILLKRISAAMEVMARKDFQELFNTFLLRVGDKEELLTLVENLLTSHIEDRTNIHLLTTLQLKLEKVINATTASSPQARMSSSSMMDIYATPYSADLSISSNFLDQLLVHDTDYGNPHKENANDLGTYSKAQFTSKNTEYYNRGETVRITQRLNGTKDGSNKTTSSGETFPEAYVRLRTNLNAAEMKSGILDYTHLTPQAPIAESVLVANTSGKLRWRSINDIWAASAPKPTQVYQFRLGFSHGGAVGWLNSNVPPSGLAEGTIAIFNQQVTYGTDWGNGNVMTTFYSFGIAVVLNRTWRE